MPWLRSSYSGAQGGRCVEAVITALAAVDVRASRAPPFW
ncbi:DUF397 domain-containing protein [Kitasatospora sp. GP30]|nr:DUF397 domain-containing protein [Kitasatospora sp. GP30]